MTVVSLEILKKEDVKLDDHPIFGLPLDKEKLEAHLEKASEEPGISFEQFKTQISKWK